MESLDLTRFLGFSLEEVSKKEAWRLQNIWRESFAREYKEKIGRWDRTLAWEYLNENPRLLHGAKSIEAFKRKRVSTFYIWTQFGNEGDRLFKGVGPISEIEKMAGGFFSKDILLFSDEMEWCLFFTHEDESHFNGPGFVER